jgi:hypothetical protein
VVGSVLDALEGIKRAMISPEEETAFAGYVRGTFGPALERIGLQPAPGEPETISLIRPRLIAWMGDEGRDPGTLAFARDRCRAYLADPASVDPSLVQVVIRLSAHGGDRALYEEYKQRAEHAATPGLRQQFLGALGSFRDPELRAATLRYAGRARSSNEIFDVTQESGDRGGSRDRHRWMTENTTRSPAGSCRIRAYLPSWPRDARAIVWRGRSSSPTPNAAPGSSASWQGDDQVMECVNLRERKGGGRPLSRDLLGTPIRAMVLV